MATVIDTLFLELGIDTSKFSGEAVKAEKQYDKLEKSVAKTEKAEQKASKATKENTEARRKSVLEHQKADAQLAKFSKTVGTVIRNFAAFTAMLLGASGLSKLAVDAAKANTALDSTAKNIGMARKELAAWQGAAEMAGGSADGMSGYMKTLSGDMNNLIMMGDTSVLPYFNALGVSLLDSSGKARKLDDVMLDLAERMSGMDRTQAYNLAKQMGMDDGTANALMRGRKEMERMLEIQRGMYHSSEADIENSRKLAEARAVLNSQWEGLKLMIGNALIPVVTFLTQKITKFVEFLVKNEHLTKGVFLGMASAISLFLMPMLVTATAMVFAFIAPFIPLIAAVTALGAAFGLLYDDYKTWSEGGNSLFDWGKFNQYINSSDVSTQSLGKAFIYLTTGYTDWSSAANGLLDWLKMKGFIDGTGVSVNSLTTGFKNLAAEIADGVMPYLTDIVDIFEKLKNGDLSGAGEALKVAAKRRWEVVKNVAGAVWDRASGATDIATGHEVGTLKEAADFAIKNAEERSLGKCAKYVNDALRSQGVKVSGHGKDVAGNLLNSNQGFKKIDYSKDYVPQIGDVMSMPSHAGSKHNYGHVAIYTKDGWVSDFKQGEKYGNTGAANGKYYKEILSGKITPTIVRRSKRNNSTSSNAVQNEDWKQKLNAKETVPNADAKLSALSREKNLPDNMLYSVWTQESMKGNLKKKSGAGADGHFQFIPSTAKEYGIRGKEWDFDASSRAAAEKLSKLLKQYKGDKDKALAAYNMGEGNLDKKVIQHGGKWLEHSPAETQKYVDNINKMMAYRNKTGFMSQPLGGHAIAANLQANQPRIEASRNAVAQQQVTNQNSTQITVNGGVNVQTSSDTVRGTVSDGMGGVFDRVSQYAVSQV